MKILLCGYVPPTRIIGANAFYENINRFKRTHDLLLFSDPDSQWGDTTKLKMSPEAPFVVKGLVTLPHKWAINNILWFQALKMARTRGYDHILFLESDCRVGCDHWDARIVDEYCASGKATICGGTTYCYNVGHFSLKALKRFQDLMVSNVDGPVPISPLGWKAADAKFPSCIFPNGAFAIYSIPWMHEMFDLTQVVSALAQVPEPFDMLVGRKMWDRFEEDAYEVQTHLKCIYSGYGDAITHIGFRKQLLISGKCVGVHQIKDEWQPL